MPKSEKYISLILVLLACVAYLYCRLESGFGYSHPDEIVPLKVIENIFNTGNWDTNWRLADLPGYYHYDQYNFSSYISASAVMIKSIAPGLRLIGLEADSLTILRFFSALFQTITILLTYAAGKAVFNSRRIGVVAAWQVAVFPLLFQDSLYGRPESFIGMLTVIMLFLTFKERRKHKLIAIAAPGVIIGFLAACKITFIVFIALLILAGFRYRGERRSFYVWLIIISGISVSAGFFLGAPYALLNWQSYLHGLEVLLSQYGSYHHPFGLPDAGIPERLIHSWNYFTSIGAGLFIVLSIIGALLILRARRYVLAAIIGLFLSVVIYFSIKPVFFERNFSFTIPLLSLSASFAIFRISDSLPFNYLFRRVISSVIIIAVTSPLLLFILRFNKLVLSGSYDQQRMKLHSELTTRYGKPIEIFEWMVDDSYYRRFQKRLREDKPEVIYEVHGSNDTYTRYYINLAVKELGMRVIAELPSPFQKDKLPPSTLYNYHAPQYFYLTDCSNLSRE